MAEIVAYSQNLKKLLNKADRLEIPIYQRSYAWEKEQCVTLINDLFESYEEDSEMEYFLGNLIITKNKGVKKIVDGQQRITTLTIIFFAIGNIMKEMYDEINLEGLEEKELIDKENERNSIMRFIDSIMNYLYKENIDLTSSDIYSLKLVSTVKNDTLEKFLNAANPKRHADVWKSLKNSNYLNNYRLIKKMLEEKLDNFTDYNNFYNWFNNKVILVEIILPEIADEQKIFESINAEGIGLTSVDLIKNFIYSRIEKSYKDDNTGKKENLFRRTEIIFEETLKKLDQRTNLEEVVFSHFLVHDRDLGNALTGREFYKEFKNHFKDSVAIDILIDRLEEFAEMFVKLATEDAEDLGTLEETSFFLNKSTIIGVLFPPIYEMFKGQNVNELGRKHPIFKEFLLILDRHTTNRFLEGKDNRNHNKSWLTNIMPMIKAWNRDLTNFDLLDNIRILFEEHLNWSQGKNNTSTLSNYVKEDVWNKFKYSSQYKSDKSTVRYLLVKYEYLLKKNNEITSLNQGSKWSVEHIMPQKIEDTDWYDEIKQYHENVFEIHESFVNKWGNLTLLTSNDNSNGSNKSWSNKKRGLINNSILRINKDLSAYEEWNTEVINARTEVMFNVLWDSIKK